MSNRLCWHFDYSPDSPGIAQIGLGMFALQYAEMGYAVLPLIRGGKKPHRMLPPDGGVHHATTDRDQVMTWWRTDPAANIGVATGQRSRLCVIDLDVKGEHNGPGQFGAFLSTWRLALPEAVPYVITPSGGDHIWLRWPAGMTVPERPGILPGVDVKGDGGLVVVPPSMQLRSRGIVPPGERGEPVPMPYVLAAGCPCGAPDAPAWVHGWLAWSKTVPREVSTRQRGMTADADVEDIAWRVYRIVTGELVTRITIPQGKRNAVLYRVACALYSHFGAQEAWDHLNAVNAEMTEQPLSYGELRTIAGSARPWTEKDNARQDAANSQLVRMVSGKLGNVTRQLPVTDEERQMMIRRISGDA